MTKYIFGILSSLSLMTFGCDNTPQIIKGTKRSDYLELLKDKKITNSNLTLIDLQGNWCSIIDTQSLININDSNWIDFHHWKPSDKVQVYKIEFDNNCLSADDIDSNGGSPCIILENWECKMMFEILELTDTTLVLKSIPSGEIELYNKKPSSP